MQRLGVASTPELRLENIVKHFGSTRALDAASLSVKPGTVHALLGENGAGKTTLMRISFGLLQPDAGRLLLNGRESRFRTPADAIAAGIGMVHQHFTNVAALTVAENIALGGHGSFSPAAAIARVADLAAETQFALDPNARASSLSVGAQQRLEILKALSRGGRILILDEPTAVLAPPEARDLLAWLRAFADTGGSVILITHKLAEALATADHVTVLRYGRTVLTSAASPTSANQLAIAMLGTAPAPMAAKSLPAAGEVVLQLSAVSLFDDRGVERVANATLTLRRHEILGVAALENSGHALLLRCIAGRLTASSGTIQREGVPALIPEDRHRDALVLPFSLTENVALKGAGARRGRALWSSWRSTARRLVSEYDVRAPSVDAAAGTLSGGNQQKLVLARELSEEPALIVAENPTRGLDIRATAEVHDRLHQAAARGAGVVLYSSDLDEVLSIATRMVSVHQGRLTEVPNEREAAGRAMLGLT